MASPTHGHEFEETPGVGDGQGGLVCCDSWCHKKQIERQSIMANDLQSNSYERKGVDTQ